MPLDLEKMKSRRGNESSAQIARMFSLIIHERYGRRTYQKIAEGGKMEKVALSMVEFSRDRGIPVKDLLEEAIGSFGVEFCQRVFHTPYPQINVVLTEKTLARLKSTNRVPVKVTKTNKDQTIQMYLDSMKDVDKDTAILCVQGGWPEGPQSIRTALIEKLKRRKK